MFLILLHASLSSSLSSSSSIFHAGISWTFWQELASWRTTLGTSCLLWHGFYNLMPFIMPITLLSVLGASVFAPEWMLYMWHQNRCFTCSTSIGAFHVVPEQMHSMQHHIGCTLHGTSKDAIFMAAIWVFLCETSKDAI